MWVRVGIGFGEWQDESADRGLDIDGVIIARELAVEIECAAGTRGGNDGDGGAWVPFYRGTSGQGWGVAVAGVEAGKIDDVRAAATNVDAGGGGGSGGSGAGAAGTGSGRDSGPHIDI